MRASFAPTPSNRPPSLLRVCVCSVSVCLIRNDIPKSYPKKAKTNDRYRKVIICKIRLFLVSYFNVFACNLTNTNYTHSHSHHTNRNRGMLAPLSCVGCSIHNRSCRYARVQRAAIAHTQHANRHDLLTYSKTNQDQQQTKNQTRNEFCSLYVVCVPTSS